MRVIIRVLAERVNKFCMTLECARDEEIRLCISEMTGETIFWDENRNLRRQQEQKNSFTGTFKQRLLKLSKIDWFAEFKGKLQNSIMKKNSKMAKLQNSKMEKWHNSTMTKWQNSKMAKLCRGQSSPFGDKTGLALDAALVILIKSYFSLSFSRYIYSPDCNHG